VDDLGSANVGHRLGSFAGRARAWASARPRTLTAGATITLVVIIVAGLALAGAGSATRSPSGMAAATQSPAATLTWAGSLAVPSSSSTQGLQNPGPSGLMVLPEPDPSTFLHASITHNGPCYFQSRPASANGLLYFHCWDYVAAVDPATNREVARYTGFWERTQYPSIMASGPDLDLLIFYDGAGGVWAQGYREQNLTVRRIDAATGKITVQIAGELVDAADGKVFIQSDEDGRIWQYNGTSGNRLAWDGTQAVDALVAVTHPADYNLHIACGKRLASSPYDFERTEARIAQAGWPDSIAEPGFLEDVLELGDRCWAKLRGDGGSYLARLGESGFETHSPLIPAQLRSFDGWLWMERWLETDGSYILQRINTATWQPEGPEWLLPDDCGTVWDAGSIAWCETGYRINLTFDGSTPTE
jgi:hypothetical protein